jgi:hypothetical protein
MSRPLRGRGATRRAARPGRRMITIDTAAGIVTVTDEGGQRTLRFEAHPLGSYVTLIEGGSTEPRVLHRVRAQIGPADRVLVAIPSGHPRP